MVKGLYTAYTGMIQEQKRLDTITNNLANSDTTGFKKEGMTNQSFDQMLAVKIKDPSSYSYARRIGGMSLGDKIGETYVDWSQGSFKNTENTFDLALGGKGFFAIAFTDKAGQTRVTYTRDGSFTVNTEGYLTTADGDYVLNANGAMNADPAEGNRIRINPLQTATIDEQGNIYQNNVLAGQIGRVDFEDYNYLEHYGENMYDTIPGYTAIASTATVNQGYLETSNVNIVEEMVEMITVSRAYEAGQKVIQSMDSTLGHAVEAGKVG